VETGMRLADGRGVVVRLAAVEPLVVRGDPSTLRRALVNLVENAIKYTKAGGTVELSLERDGRDAVMAVSDDGVGMDPVDADRIFEPFVRLDAARAGESSGAGLGLSIVHSIVAAHDGRVTVRTAPGVGSTFASRLPLVRSSGFLGRAPPATNTRGVDTIRRRGDRACRLIGLVGIVVFLISAFTPLAYRLNQWMAEPARLAPSDAIVVLGGSISPSGLLSLESL